jgi:thiol:disulfide interchange protein DsbC
VRDQAVGATSAAGCDVAAITRNVELGRKHKVNGTPTLVFADGTRVPGAVSAAQVEKYLGASN